MCAWIQHIHNKLVDAESDLARGVISSSRYTKIGVYTRTVLHQLFLIMTTRYGILRRHKTDAASAAAVSALIFDTDDPHAVYYPIAAHFDGTANTVRQWAVARNQGIHAANRHHRGDGPPPAAGGQGRGRGQGRGGGNGGATGGGGGCGGGGGGRGACGGHEGGPPQCGGARGGDAHPHGDGGRGRGGGGRGGGLAAAAQIAAQLPLGGAALAAA